MQQLRERTADIVIVLEPDADDLLYSLPVEKTRYRAYVCDGHPSPVASGCLCATLSTRR